MPTTTITVSISERAMISRLQKKYGTVRNTLVQGLRTLEKYERGTLADQASRDEKTGTDAHASPAFPSSKAS